MILMMRPTMGIWTELVDGLAEDFSDLPSLKLTVRLVARLLIAAVLGGLLGFEREEKSKPAGLRTHMLVALGSAVFVVIAQQYGMSSADLSRVIQGIVTGIGFIGAGAILKLSEQGQVHGLTTAASIWLAAAVGLAAGLGKTMSAALGTVLALGILAILPKIERWIHGGNRQAPH
jgi:putative Mg2+ transporter-C (MgtC) family protein